MVFGEKPMCLSGGADGADLLFGMCAGTAGHIVIHWSFEGARSSAPESELAVLSEDQLVEADPYLKTANRSLKRRFPARSEKTNNLLRRNWYQIRDADAIYAVSTLTEGVVDGGTAWAVQMFIDRFDGDPCPAFVFDQVEERWRTWNGTWELTDDIPSPIGVYAGVGTRKLNLAGKTAIKHLLNYKPA